jgi:nickel transport protein
MIAMKTCLFRISLVCFAILAIFLLPSFAFAHGVKVFAYVDGDTIRVEGQYSGGKKVDQGNVLVQDLQGNELLSGKTNEQGEYVFKIPVQTDLKIVLMDDQGHRAEWIVPASDMMHPISKTETSVQDKNPQNQEKAGSSRLMARAELEAVIESVLDRKLEPVYKALADAHQQGPSLRDILGGIGYILGLVGIALYVQSRKNKG